MKQDRCSITELIRKQLRKEKYKDLIDIQYFLL